MFKRLIYWNYRAYTGVSHRLTRRVTKTGWLVLGAVIVSGALGLDTNLALAYKTFALLFSVLLVATVYTMFLRTHVVVERLLPKYGSAGEALKYQMIVRNPSRRAQRNLTFTEDLPDPRPSWREFVTTPEPGEEKRNWYDRSQGWYRWMWLVSKNRRAVAEERPLGVLAPKGTLEMAMEILPTKRGYLRLAGVTAFLSDPLGIFRSTKRIKAPDSILILPKRYSIPPLDLPGMMKYQPGGVSMASSIGESEEFVALRDYRAGDPLRHIHWRSFAKIGKPIVKEFQDEFFVRHALVLDTFNIPLHSEVFEEAVSVAASFAYTIQTQDSLLDLLFVGPQAYCFTAGRGVGQTEQMLEILASVQPCPDGDFNSLRQLVLEHIGTVSGCICIFIHWDEARQNMVEHLKILGVPTRVFVVTDGATELSPGPMADNPEYFRVLPLGKVGEELAKI